MCPIARVCTADEFETQELTATTNRRCQDRTVGCPRQVHSYTFPCAATCHTCCWWRMCPGTFVLAPKVIVYNNRLCCCNVFLLKWVRVIHRVVSYHLHVLSVITINTTKYTSNKTAVVHDTPLELLLITMILLVVVEKPFTQQTECVLPGNVQGLEITEAATPSSDRICTTCALGVTFRPDFTGDPCENTTVCVPGIQVRMPLLCCRYVECMIPRMWRRATTRAARVSSEFLIFRFFLCEIFIGSKSNGLILKFSLSRALVRTGPGHN